MFTAPLMVLVMQFASHDAATLLPTAAHLDAAPMQKYDIAAQRDAATSLPTAAHLDAAPNQEDDIAAQHDAATSSPTAAHLDAAPMQKNDIAAQRDAAPSLPTAAHLDAAPMQKDDPSISVSVGPRARRGHRSRGALEKPKKRQTTTESASRNVLAMSHCECSSLARLASNASPVQDDQ
jgi:hypothetical protein